MTRTRSILFHLALIEQPQLLFQSRKRVRVRCHQDADAGQQDENDQDSGASLG